MNHLHSHWFNRYYRIYISGVFPLFVCSERINCANIRVFLQPAPCLAPCLVNFSLYKYGAIRSSAPFHLVNLTRSYTELTWSRPQIAPCLAPYGSVFSSVLGKSDKIFKIWKKSKRLKSALNTQLSMKE